MTERPPWPRPRPKRKLIERPDEQLQPLKDTFRPRNKNHIPLWNQIELYIGVNTGQTSRQGFLTGPNMSRESHFGITRGKPGKNAPLRADVLEAFLKKATELHSDGRFDEAARFYQHVRDCNPEAL